MIRSLRAAAFGLCACALHPRSAADRTLPATWQYTVRVSPTLSELTVTFCAPAGYDGRLEVPSDEGRRALRSPVNLSDGSPLNTDGGFIEVHTHNGSECVRWGVDLGEALPARRFQGNSAGVVRASTARWLWRPTRWRAGAVASLRVELPPGVEASGPWPGETTGFSLDSGAFWWDGALLVGSLRAQRVQTPGAEFRVVRAARDRGPADDTVARWLTESARATSLLLGRFPVERVQVVLVPHATGGDPVAIGLTHRGGGASIMLVVNPDAAVEALTRDWVAVHESVHLAHPVLRDQDAWLGEGLATYYQEVLRARAGLTTEREAWTELCAGFDRGRALAGGRSLREDSATMHQRGSYVRVYWAGVAAVMSADVAMRRRGDPQGSLDTLVRALDRAARGEALRTWTADEALGVWDLAAGFDLSRAVITPLLDQPGFPEMNPVLRALGVRWNGREISFDDGAPDAALRRAITAGVP